MKEEITEIRQNPIRSAMNVFFMVLTLILYSDFFNFGFWADTPGPKIQLAYGALCMMAAFVGFQRMPKDYPTRKIVLALIALLVMSLIASLMIGGYSQGTKKPIFMIMGFGMFFNLWQLKITEKQIITGFVIFGLMTFAIQIWQMSMEFPVFGLDYEMESGEIGERNDLARYMVGTYFVAVLCVYYFWSRIIKKFNIFAAVMLAVFLVSVYLYLTRQLMIAIALSALLSIFILGDRKKQIAAFMLILVLGAVVFFNAKAIFGDMLEDTDDSTNIRWQCMDYIRKQLELHIEYIPFGRGFGDYEKAWAAKGYYISDIGFVGQVFVLGIFWTVSYFVIVYKFLTKLRHDIPMYVTLFVFGSLVTCLFIFPYRNMVEAFIWATLFYISSIHLSKAEEEEEDEDDEEAEDEEEKREITA